MPNVGNVGFSEEERGPEKREIRFVASLRSLGCLHSGQLYDSTSRGQSNFGSAQIYRLKTELARCRQWPLRVKVDCR